MADGAADEPMETRALALLRALIAAQPEGEAAVQAIIADRLRAAGCTVEELTYEPGSVELINEFASDAVRNAETRTAIVGRLPGAAGKASLMMFAHPDGEPAGDTANWTHPAFEGTLDGGKLYGWGVADDLAGCASAVLAIEEAAKTPGLGEIIFASTPSKRHARGVSALMRKGLTADASLYLHPAESGVGMREIKNLASGQLEFKVTVEGGLPPTTEPGHTAFSHLADNAIDKFVLLHGALKALADDRAGRIRHALIEAEVGRATNLHISTVVCGPMKKFSRLNPLLEFGGAIAFPPGETLDEVKAEVEGAIAKAAAGDPWLAEHPPVVAWLSGVTGAEVTMDSPLWQVSSAAVERITGAPPHVNPMHTSSDIRNPMVQAGIPCVGLGCLCGDLSQNGKHDEWVDAADFIRMVDVATAVTTDWCSRPRGA